jgi:phenylalanyl-tRNA synthetase beta chain
LKLFELEKTFLLKKDSEITENYNIAWVITSKQDIVYYSISNIISDFLRLVKVDNFYFDKTKSCPSYSHKWRTAEIIVRWKKIWIVWEIHPKVTKNFWLKSRIWFFEINADLLKNSIYSKIKAKEISTFQENNFDLSFVVDKSKKWREIKNIIEKTDQKLIKKVELFDIFESEEKLPWKRSLSFKVHIQSMTKTLNDVIKNSLIDEIVRRVEKNWWELRW